MQVTFAAPSATATLSADTAARRLSGLAVPFGVASEPSGGDGVRYRFAGPPRNTDDLVDVVFEHDTNTVLGRLAEPWAITETGMDATARMFNTTRGNDALVEASEGARASFSVGVLIHKFTTDPDGVRDVAAGDWDADHLGVVRRPAFTQTRGITVHANARNQQEEPPTMTDTITPPAVVELPTIAELAAQVAEVLKPVEGAHPLASFATFDAFVAAFVAADEDRRDALATAFAVPDQVTGDNPGVIPPGWRTDIKMRLDARRPAIRSLGSIGLPSAGMDANWPYLDPTLNLDQIIQQQLAEKDELAGVKIKILKGTEPIKTAGTVSDISYQLLMRSDPSYLAAYQRICMAAWARYTEAKFEAKLLAAGTNAGALSVGSASAFRTQLFAASADVEDATGAPADTVLVDRATFTTLGGMEALKNPKYGTQNVTGTSDASTLRINVDGLEVTRAPFLPANTMIVANGDAAKFAESGPMIATAENVTKLGRDVAVWGMYEDGEIYFPAGVRVYKPAG